MESRYWGDETHDWKAVGDAANYISSFCRRWGRLGGQSKEKYGSVRFYALFGGLSLHTLIYPGYHFNQFPKWFWNLDCRYISRIMDFFFGKLFFKWQKVIYNKAYQNAIKKWPHLRGYILCDADYPEWIKGVTKREGKYLHIVDIDGTILSTWETGE